MTQGWDQAAMAGAAIEAMNDLGKPFVSTAAYDLTPTSDDNNLPLGANTWWLGFAVGAPFLCGAFLGLFFTDRLPELWRFGRRGAIIVAGTCSFISVIGCAASHNFWEFLAFRIILGAGMAGKAAIVPIWLSETSPRNVRGVLLVCWQLFVACGIAAGSVANLSLYRLNPSESWRYMFISAFIPALLLFSMVLFAPESPRWLLKRSGFKKSEKLSDFEFEKRRKGLVRAALKSLSQLHGKPTNMLAAGELYLLYMRLLQEQDFLKKENDDQSHSKFNEHASREATNEFTSKVAVTGHASGVAVNMHSTEARVNGDTPAAVVNENRSTIIDNQGQQSIKAPHNTPIEYVSWGQRWRLMISTRRMTRANGAAAAVMIAQQLCGINLLAFLAGTFFRNSFFSNSQNPTLQDNTKHLWLSFAFGVVNFLFTIPALFYIDRSEGRRTLLNWSFPCMFATLLISGLILRKSTNDSATGRVGTGAGIAYIVLLMLFTAAYSIGEGPAAFVISAEVFPLTNRELGMSLAVFWNFLGAGVLALCAPAMTRNLGQDNTLFFFSGMNILAWFLCYWLVPNTGSEDLEDIFEQLEAPTHFVFVYTCAILLRKAFRGLEWCHGAGCRSWKNCGFIQLETAEDEYKEHVGQDADWKAMIKSFWGKAFRKGARRHT
ncbi:MFS general substrate transporter [Cucurbitaria berberidis CBS 394.84]|uniref:MFS general substrate transporter n=1 Tax=Cucurbitaria berberidis CBS 394.84 TaxID=1168544 RepID=A0A9P4GMZ5_9PLEO|nr:MFS general substrate transporter [Cucurbitaria berberidis CBS 394.84]KAF1849418.1 MFS general substrate transporter [Cucurbitaria berberidis CBS 394.84]